MIASTNRAAFTACAIAALSLASPITGAFAQTTATRQKPNVIQRHPTATGVAAGAATHHALKVSAARKKQAHRRLSWAERHPTLSGVGAAIATRHVVKKTTRH